MFKLPFCGRKTPAPCNSLTRFLTPPASEEVCSEIDVTIPQPGHYSERLRFLVEGSRHCFGRGTTVEYTVEDDTIIVSGFADLTRFSLKEFLGGETGDGEPDELRSVILDGLLNRTNKSYCTLRFTAAAYEQAPPELRVVLDRIFRTRTMPLPRPLGCYYGCIYVGKLIIDGLGQAAPVRPATLPLKRFEAKGTLFYPLI